MSEKIENISWSATSRLKNLKRLQEEKFDLIIIGGGITGAGIAREAALRGIKTALVDKEDFGFGTSSRSSKLVHGGFRYLKTRDFKLVRESTTERNWLRSHFAHNIRPAKTNVCVYENGSLSEKQCKLGIRIYDFLSNFMSKFKQFGKHQFFDRESALQEHPYLNPEGLQLVGQYYDTHVDDGRLTLETIKEALHLGDVVALNYCKALGFEITNGKITGIDVSEKNSNSEFVIHGSQIINATGIWTDDLLQENGDRILRPTKGVHVVVPMESIGAHDDFGVNSIDDNRFFFILNRDDIAIIGTTDTDYVYDHKGKPNEDLDLPYCTKEDCDYLFHTVNHIFPTAKLTYDDILATYAGIRPLVMEQGKDESQVSRKHVILDSPNGLTTICGGKLTTYRVMAEEIIYHIIKTKGGFQKMFPKRMLKKGFSKRPFLITLSKEEWEYRVENIQPELEQDTLHILYQQYGKGAIEILHSLKDHPEWKEKIHSDHPFIIAEIHYILDHECAPHLIDVLRRRTEIFMKIKHDQQKMVAEIIAGIMAKKYQWTEEHIQEEIKGYMNHIKRTIWF